MIDDWISVGIYTDKETFNEKKRYVEEGKWVWWNLNTKPYRGHVKTLFVAFDEQWQGFFSVERVEPIGVSIKSDVSSKYSIFLYEWHELTEKISRTPFQGFTYNVPKVEEGE